MSEFETRLNTFIVASRHKLSAPAVGIFVILMTLWEKSGWREWIIATDEWLTWTLCCSREQIRKRLIELWENGFLLYSRGVGRASGTRYHLRPEGLPDEKPAPVLGCEKPPNDGLGGEKQPEEEALGSENPPKEGTLGSENPPKEGYNIYNNNNIPMGIDKASSANIPLDIVTEFNSRCPDLESVSFITEKRANAIEAAFSGAFHGSMDEVREYFDRVAESSFLCGRKKKFRAVFDWLIKPATIEKVFSGLYDDGRHEDGGDVFDEAERLLERGEI